MIITSLIKNEKKILQFERPVFVLRVPYRKHTLKKPVFLTKKKKSVS
jgi:hypothetical protein